MAGALDLLPVAIHGVPRSGTSWLGEILNSSPATVYKFQPLFSYRFKSFLGPTSSAAEIDDFFRRVAASSDDFLDQTERRSSGSLPTFDKERPTHLVYKEVRYHHILPNLLERCPELRLVSIVRNPIAVISSWLRAPREFRADLGWQPLEEWRRAPSKNQGRPEEFYGYEKWKEATRLFFALEREHSGRVVVVDYHQLVTDRHAAVERIFDCCGLAITRQTEDFLARSASRDVDDPYGVYRSRSTDDEWTRHLDAEIAAAIAADLRGDDLERLLH
jgi:hypothetical protein